MPPGEQKVSAKEIATIEAWIAAGARTARKEPAEIGPGTLITDEDRDYWAFRPIRRPSTPKFDRATASVRRSTPCCFRHASQRALVLRRGGEADAHSPRVARSDRTACRAE